ncbi:VCBS repeat-containing protein [soil metagenome]
MMRTRVVLSFVILFVTCSFVPTSAREGFDRIGYNNPGLVVDLGVGLWAWPIPMDFDGDGDLDLVVSCPDTPYSGTYFFENVGDGGKMPVFRPGVRVGPALRNVQVSYVDGESRLLMPGKELVDFRSSGFERSETIYPKDNIHENRIRANQWKYVDFEGNGVLDLVVGVGDWTDYGWDDAFDAEGNWTNGPLHGYVYRIRNEGTNDAPQYADPVKLQAGDEVIDVYGMPSPNFADFDGDGDLDLICGEFLDGFTYFENVGTRAKPEYAAGRRLVDEDGELIRMDLQMITPVAIDWTGNGHVDLIVGDEDGRVALVEHTGEVVDGLPRFRPPVYFQQEAADVKFGALVTPVSFDWDGDGDEDLIVGNTAGSIGFIENLDGGNPPRWAAPRLLEADGEVIRIMAGPSGSIQGPCEAKWGYTAPSVADWNHNGLPDLIVNSIWGTILWYPNIGTRTEPVLAAARPIQVAWKGSPPKPDWNWWDPEADQLVTQWRTTPVVVDFNGDGLNDLVMLDHEGFLTYCERTRQGEELVLLPGRRIFRTEGPSEFDQIHRPLNEDAGLLQLNSGHAGRSGRRKFCITDFDGDGKLDLIVNSRNVNILRNVSAEGAEEVTFQDLGLVDDQILAGHTTSPTVVDWNRDGRPDLLIGAEDGRLYYFKNPGEQGDR